MNIVKVAEALSNLIEAEINQFPVNVHKDTGAGHLQWMLDKILSQGMSNDKANRWIGYVQGCLVTHGITDVEAMKALNRE